MTCSKLSWNPSWNVEDPWFQSATRPEHAKTWSNLIPMLGMVWLTCFFLFSGGGGAASAIRCFSYSFNRLSSAGHRREFILWSVIFELSSCHSCQFPSVYWIHPNNADSPLSVFSFRVLLDWSQWRTNLWRSTGLLWLRNQCNMYLSQQN